MGMFPTTLGRHRGQRAFEDLEQRLLDTLAGDVAGDRRVFGLASDLVDLIDIDDPLLGTLDVEVGSLDQLEQDVLDVLTDIAGLGESGGVGDGERHVEQPGEGLGHERLARPGGPNQQDVRLLELDLLVGGALAGAHPLVVVVDRDREDLLGVVLTDDVLGEEVVDLVRLWQLGERDLLRGGQLLVDDLVAEIDALVTDVYPGPGDELLDLFLGLAAERALEKLGSFVFGHGDSLPARLSGDCF